MSIQKLEFSDNVQGSGDVDRTIDKDAIGIILDTAMITQYTRPEQSTVRELTANAVDAEKEKRIALKILEGDDISKYYVDRTNEGDTYKASKFDSDYYDKNWLDTTKSEVELIYEESPLNGFTDKFIVRDYGVGLGGSRLQGYFKIGYSTKRGSMSSLGAFGYGNKASLSLHNNYYTMETWYNGRNFKFNCFARSIVSLIGKFNEDGTENDFILFDNESDPDNPISIYYRKVTRKNGTEITVPLKRTHRYKFRDAVKDQLLYIKGVKFTYINEYGTSNIINFNANILYNSENLLISDTHRYGEPHIVIVKDKNSTEGICYGNVDFDELEMQRLYGKVGFKCPIRSVVKDDNGNDVVLQEGVSVTPSREEVIWDEHTRAYVKMIIESASDEATKIINESLETDDFVEWNNICKSILNNGNNDTLRQLSRIVDQSKINPTFKNTGITSKYFTSSDCGIKVETLSLRIRDGKILTTVDSLTDPFGDKKIFILDSNEKLNENTNIFLLREMSGPDLKDDFDKRQDLTIYNAIRIVRPIPDYELIKRIKKNYTNITEDNINKKIEAIKDKRDKVVKLIADSENADYYKNVTTPENWSETLANFTVNTENKTLSYQELRKEKNGIFTYRARYNHLFDDTTYSKFNVEISKLKKFVIDGGTIYYIYNHENVEYMDSCVAINTLNETSMVKIEGFEETVDAINNCIFLKLSKSNGKKLANEGIPINNVIDYISNPVLNDDGTITIETNDSVKRFYKSRSSQSIADIDILKYFDSINYDKYELFLKTASKINQDRLSNKIHHNIIETLDAIKEFQMKTAVKSMSEKERKTLSIKLFGVDNVVKCDIVDLELLDNISILKDYVSKLKLLNVIHKSSSVFRRLTGYRRDVDLIKYIKEYLDLIGVGAPKPDDESITNN